MTTSEDRRVEFYQDRAGRWRWRCVAERGNLPPEIIADSGHSYSNRSNARRAGRSVFPHLPLVFVEHPR